MASIGGFYDHIVPPFQGVPNDEAPCWARPANASCNAAAAKNGVGAFDFRRLGLRAAAMLISPWVAKGAVIQAPEPGRRNGGGPAAQFEHSSIPATLKSLFNLTGFLTKRDAWAASFESVLLDALRPEAAPLHFPTAPPPRDGHWGPWKNNTPSAAANVSKEVEGRRRLDLLRPPASGSLTAQPQHCSMERPPHEACMGAAAVTAKQWKSVDLYSSLTMTPRPDIDSMTHQDASVWLRARRAEWLDSDGA
eukprot:SAG22_NODE_339_length_12034_cov_3.087474_2_plen_250_part_00